MRLYIHISYKEHTKIKPSKTYFFLRNQTKIKQVQHIPPGDRVWDIDGVSTHI